MLCIMSATLPFFRCPDDCTALAEITTVFGTTKMTQCARKLGICYFIFSFSFLIYNLFIYLFIVLMKI